MNSLFFCAAMSALADYSEHERAVKLIDEMVTEHGFEKTSLLALFSQAQRKEDILGLIAKPAEKRLEWFEYKRIFITEDRINQGLVFMQTYQNALVKAEAEFGVPKEIIAAIIGVETRYGKHKGIHRVLDALSTLGFDYPPRADFFYSELKHALLLAREQGFNLLTIKGSYAGAMGYGQFIPSSYRNYAVDFDGDNIVDILENPVDAIGSVANYFVKHHWKAGEPIALPLREEDLGSHFAQFQADDLKPVWTIAQIQEAGVKLPQKLDPTVNAKIQNYVFEEHNQNWLTLHNFYVITRYNHSHLYAMAVYELAKALGLKGA